MLAAEWPKGFGTELGVIVVVSRKLSSAAKAGQSINKIN